MKKILLTGLLMPLFASSQEVQPVISPDYLALVRNDSVRLKTHRSADTATNISQSVLRYRGYQYADRPLIKKINVEDGNAVRLIPVVYKDLSVTGSLSTTAEIQRINRLPALQKEYVQGRPVNGAPGWRGPETNEMFSYGPAIQHTEFDGTDYPYDTNGKLVAAGAGNGKKGIAYSPAIFRTAVIFSNHLVLQTRYRSGYQRQLTSVVKAGKSHEDTWLVSNTNNRDHFSASLEGVVKGFTISPGYNYSNERASNSNRSGFINRVYQNALLSPVSFDNSQVNTTGGPQRSYSGFADNPFFLLADKDHLFQQQTQTGSLMLEQKISNGKIRLSQSYEHSRQQSNEGYQPGTAFYPGGIAVQRIAGTGNYLLDANFRYQVAMDDHHINTAFTANYTYSNNRSDIGYAPANRLYKYKRSSQDAAIGLAPTYRGYNLEAGLNFVDKLYVSSTAVSQHFFLPAVSMFTRFNELLGVNALSCKLTAAYSRFNNELPLSVSFAQNSMAQYKASDVLQYLPVTEVSSFNNLSAIEHREYTAEMELDYRGGIVLTVDWFNRHTDNDIFPIANAGKIALVNMAAHLNKGVEVQLKLNSRSWYQTKPHLSTNIAFITYHTKVTDVKSGYDFTPVAGYADINKALVKGMPLGVIVGSRFARDAANNLLIGKDGFPLADGTPAVIGDPTPDFVIKTSHYLTWRKWNFNIDWEWRKGGQIWNGTEAMLDYYGRSPGSAMLRNTTNYIFDGVQQNGAHNTIPVNFYDPALPLQQNRWVRYGPTGVGEAYIQKADCIRINNISLSHQLQFKKYLRQLAITLYANNIIFWSAYKGADPSQLLNGQPGTTGLDLFNLPTYRSFGLSASLQF